MTDHSGSKRRRHNDAETTAIVHQYGLLDPIDWGEDCEDQLRGMTALWNTLVEIDQAYTASYSAAIAGDPAVKDLRDRYEALTAEIEALIKKRHFIDGGFRAVEFARER